MGGVKVCLGPATWGIGWPAPGFGLQLHAEVCFWPLVQMEWVDGEIWGNVWQTECIARIDPATGAVLGWIMLQVAASQQLSQILQLLSASISTFTLSRSWH